ncbi:MAG: DUF726 domain-containing protein [PVC group bacterium]
MTEQNKVHSDLIRILKSLPGSRGEKLILIHGCFHSREFRDKDYRAWAHSCRRAGFRGEIDGFYWESFDYAALLEDFAEGLAGVVRKGFKGAADLAVQALHGSRERWQDSKAQAISAGEELARHVSSTGSSEKVILMGHSLGARVIKTCLESLAKGGTEVKKVYLLGAAVPSGESWAGTSRAVLGEIINCYSTNDAVLQIPYHAAELLSGIADTDGGNRAVQKMPAGLLDSPAGLRGIAKAGKKVANVDVSNFVDRHNGFEKTLHRFVKF